MTTALLVLRLIPGLVLMDHGLQKLIPPTYSPSLLNAAGHRVTAASLEWLGIWAGPRAVMLAVRPKSRAASCLRPGSSRRSARSSWLR
jgi:hypothetical protein